MSENDQTQPVRPEGDTALPPVPAASPAAGGTAATEPAPVAAPTTGRRGFHERFGALRSSDGNRSFGLAALIASALAGIIVGGLGLTAVQAVGDDHGRDRGGSMQQRGPMGGGRDGDLGDRGGRGPMVGGPDGGPDGGPGGVPGQVQPPMPPDDDGSNG